MYYEHVCLDIAEYHVKILFCVVISSELVVTTQRYRPKSDMYS